MEYKEFLDNLHKNNMLNENGYNEYVRILKQDVFDLKLKIIGLQVNLENKKK